MTARTVTFKGNPVKLVGKVPEVGAAAPDFACVGAGLEVVTLAKTPAKARLFSVVPSLDTGVCQMQTKKFNEQINALGDKVACYTVSLDMPFAQKRDSATPRGSRIWPNLSDMHNGSFGKALRRPRRRAADPAADAFDLHRRSGRQDHVRRDRAGDRVASGLREDDRGAEGGRRLISYSPGLGRVPLPRKWVNTPIGGEAAPSAGQALGL